MGASVVIATGGLIVGVHLLVWIFDCTCYLVITSFQLTTRVSLWIAESAGAILRRLFTFLVLGTAVVEKATPPQRAATILSFTFDDFDDDRTPSEVVSLNAMGHASG